MEAATELGPQEETDGPFQARMRLHQSWYRANVLGVPHGDGPANTGGRPLGSVLTREHAAAGRNFLDRTIFDVARHRLRSGGGVEPFACLADLLSSRPLCFNLWGPLVADTDLATALLRTLVADLDRVVEVHIAYAPSPRSEYLGDRTSFDAFVGYLRHDGGRAFLAVLTRLTTAPDDALAPTARHRELLDAPGEPWAPGSVERLAEPGLAPLWRTHLLAEALRRHPAEPYQHGRCAVVRHPDDPLARAAVEAYRTCLRTPEESFADWPLDELLTRWEQVGLGDRKQWLEGLRVRYLDLHRSEAVWADAAGRHAVASAGER